MKLNDEIIKMKFTKSGAHKIINVHRGVLCQSSGFFQNVLKPEWAALREQPDVIDLPHDFETVSHYIRWLYSGNLSIKLYNAGHDTRERRAEEAEKVFVLLAEAYVFGEEILDTKYKKAVMKAVLATIDSSTRVPGYECVNIIYKGTPSTSPFRRLIANQVAYFAYDDSEKRDNWMSFFDDLPREALLDALKATVRVRDHTKRGSRSLSSFLKNEVKEKEEDEEDGEDHSEDR